MKKLKFKSIEELDQRLERRNADINLTIKESKRLLNPWTLGKALILELFEYETFFTHVLTLITMLFSPVVYIVIFICLLANYKKIRNNNKAYLGFKEELENSKL
jgi:cbb3-type cytochrome oxidase subunit 3